MPTLPSLEWIIPPWLTQPCNCNPAMMPHTRTQATFTENNISVKKNKQTREGRHGGGSLLKNSSHFVDTLASCRCSERRERCMFNGVCLLSLAHHSIVFFLLIYYFCTIPTIRTRGTTIETLCYIHLQTEPFMACTVCILLLNMLNNFVEILPCR